MEDKMANVKATDIIIIREMFKERGDQNMNALASILTPETLKTMKSVLAPTWVPIEVEAEILQEASKLLFPNDPRPLFQLGYKVAGKNFTGIYKFFLRIPSVAFIIKNVSSTYNTMLDKGVARVDGLTSNGATFVISSLPELPPVHREYICGMITCILELGGAKNLKVGKVENNPNEWKWLISWK
jgi:hypothetical protein